MKPPLELRWHTWWGLLAGSYAGAGELRRRGKRLLMFDAPRAGVTVVIARGERRDDIKERVNDMLDREYMDSVKASLEDPFYDGGFSRGME